MTTLAALDLGTNNCRMLIADEGGRVVLRHSKITRLGERLATTGRLSKDAMDRTADALRECAALMADMGADRHRGVATEACRRAANGREFLGRVRAEAGIAFDLIDAEAEARLTLAGCAGLLDPAKPRALLVDIGGGSTEATWIEDGAPVASISLPLGVVTLADEYGFGPLSRAANDAIKDRVARGLADFDREHGISERIAEVQMLGTSGTMTTLGALHLNQDEYDRAAVDGLDVPFAAVAALSERLRALDAPARAAIPCVGAARGDLVAVGCAVLDAVCALWPVGALRLADRGIMEGLLTEMARAR